MLACGTAYQPLEIRREIQLFPSSTRPARVDTDVGEGFIKGTTNPQGVHCLVSELIAAELGVWMGLAIPPFAVVQNCDIDIQMMDHGGLIDAPMFFSRAIDGTPRDTGTTFLKRLQKPEDVAKLVVFDTWIRNNDRFVDGNPNSDNLLYSEVTKGRKYSLVPIDHSHCFVDIGFDTDLPDLSLIEDETVYGLYPEFESFMIPRYVAAATTHLSSLNRSFVEECVNSVPSEWNMSAGSRANTVEFICARAEYVVNTISKKIVDAPELPGIDKHE
tara:strand:+ start:333 stop:1151 length:819 start_codon:yes stop_codon:yes gene_type:complete